MSTKESKEEDDGTIVYHRGYRLPGSKFFKPENIESSINYKPLDDDIILCAFPKTGNTWITLVIWMILHKDEPFPDFTQLVETGVPFMERTGTGPVEALKPPRFYKNHFSYGLMVINDKAKYVYTYRRPEDTVLSLYHFLKSPGRTNLNFNEFFNEFLLGNTVYGDYFDHVLEAYAHKDDGHLLMVSYEDLKADPRKQILRLAEFFGKNYYDALKSDESYIEKIVEQTSFDYMKKNLKMTVKVPGDNGQEKELLFFRKGIVGEGRETLSEDQLETIRAIIKDKMKGTDILNEWLL